MSIEIKRNLNIVTIDYFYKVIKVHDVLIDKHHKFAAFHDYMYSYYNGCPCNADNALANAKQEFDDLSKTEECILILKNHFNCDNVIFNK